MPDRQTWKPLRPVFHRQSIANTNRSADILHKSDIIGAICIENTPGVQKCPFEELIMKLAVSTVCGL
jgi:hypothetical protein